MTPGSKIMVLCYNIRSGRKQLCPCLYNIIVGVWSVAVMNAMAAI